MEETKKTPKITFYIPENECTSLKIMCVLTHTSMSHFIRSAIKSKINELKSNIDQKTLKDNGLI